MKVTLYLLAATAACISGLYADEPATAAHVGFTPGDACFVVNTVHLEAFFSETMIESETGDEPASLPLEYSYPATNVWPSLPRYFGFAHMRLTDRHPDDWKALALMVRLLAAEADSLQSERLQWGSDGPVVWSMVIVNRGFDYQDRNPFLRYNESWFLATPDKVKATGTMLAGDKRAFPCIYQSHVPSAATAANDWRYSADVAPLAVRYPDSVTFGNDKEEDTFLRRHRLLEAVEASFRDVTILGFAGVGPIEASHRRTNACFYSLTGAVLHRHRLVINDNAEPETVIEIVAPAKRSTPPTNLP